MYYSIERLYLALVHNKGQIADVIHFAKIPEWTRLTASRLPWACDILSRGANLGNALESPIRDIFTKATVNMFAKTGRIEDIAKVRLMVDGEDCGALTNLNVDKLLAMANPSSFGKGDETVYDTNVCTAVSGCRVPFSILVLISTAGR